MGKFESGKGKLIKNILLGTVIVFFIQGELFAQLNKKVNNKQKTKNGQNINSNADSDNGNSSGTIKLELGGGFENPYSIYTKKFLPLLDEIDSQIENKEDKTKIKLNISKLIKIMESTKFDKNSVFIKLKMLNRIGVEYSKIGENDESLKHFSKMVSLFLENERSLSEIQIGQGFDYFIANYLDEANKALGINKDLASIIANLSNILPQINESFLRNTKNFENKTNNTYYNNLMNLAIQKYEGVKLGCSEGAITIEIDGKKTVIKYNINPQIVSSSFFGEGTNDDKEIVPDETIKSNVLKILEDENKINPDQTLENIINKIKKGEKLDRSEVEWLTTLRIKYNNAGSILFENNRSDANGLSKMSLWSNLFLKDKQVISLETINILMTNYDFVPNTQMFNEVVGLLDIVEDPSLSLKVLENLVKIVDNFDRTKDDIKDICDNLEKTQKKGFFGKIKDKGKDKILVYLSKLIKYAKDKIKKNEGGYEKTVAQLNKELEEQKKELENKNKKISFSGKVIGALGSSLIGLLAFFGIRGKKKNKKLQEALNENKELIDVINNLISTPFLLVNANDLTVSLSNKATKDTFGDIEGKHIYPSDIETLLKKEELSELEKGQVKMYETIQEVIDKEQPLEIIIPIKLKENKDSNESHKNYKVSLTPIIENDKVIKVMIIDTEVEDLVEEVITQKKDISQVKYLFDGLFEITLDKLKKLKENKKVKDFFVINKPTEGIGGDHINVLGNKVFLGDGTGHGRQGAFMNIVAQIYLHLIEYIKNEDKQPVDKKNNETPNYIENREKFLQGHFFDNKEQLNNFTTNICYIDIDQMKAYNGKDNKVLILRKKENEENYEIFEIRKRNGEGGVFDIKKGDIVYMLSDGYVDQFGGNEGKRFKTKKLKELLIENANKPIKDQKALLEKSFDDRKGDETQIDDVLVIGVQV